MKNNKNKLSSIENFKVGMKIAMKNYCRKSICKNAKRSLMKSEMLSTCENCNVKRCKV
ncbi:MAG: hypothetical protein QG614_271 [Patescibacteria group bacterium]|nr:hypothetical protein [Patescibacteria group bacterium]